MLLSDIIFEMTSHVYYIAVSETSCACVVLVDANVDYIPFLIVCTSRLPGKPKDRVSFSQKYSLQITNALPDELSHVLTS